MSDLRKWMNLMEGTYPEPPKADLSEPEAPMEDDPEFENEDGERSAVDHMAEAEVDSLDMTSDEVDQAFDDILKKFEDGDLEKWLKANDDATPPLELVVADIKLRGPDSLGLYIIDEDKLQELIEAGEIDEDMMHYFQNAQEELRIELAQFQKEMGESEEDPMLNDDGELSPLSVDAEDVCEDSDLARMLEMAGISGDAMSAQADLDRAWEIYDQLPNQFDLVMDYVDGSSKDDFINGEEYFVLNHVEELLRGDFNEQVQEDEFDGEEDEEEVSDEKMVDIGDVDDVLDAQDEIPSLDKEMGDAVQGSAPENVDELIQAIMDAQALGMSQAKAYYSDDMLINMSPERVKMAYSKVMGEGLEEEAGVEEGWSPDVYNMDYNEKTGDVVGDVEVFGGDQDGGEMSLDVEFEYDAATDEIKIHTDYHSEGLEIGAYFDDDDVHQQVRDEVHEFIDAVEKRRAGDVEEDGKEFPVEEVEMEEDIAGVDPDVEAAILQLASALGLDSADQDDAEVIGKKLDVDPSDVHKVINQDLTQESQQ